MATETYKVLGQAKTSGGANSDVDIYTVPAATSTVVSSIIITETGGTAATVILKVRVGGAASDAKQFVYSAVPLNANDTIVLTAGITLATTDVLTFQASTTTVTAQAFGVQIT